MGCCSSAPADPVAYSKDQEISKILKKERKEKEKEVKLLLLGAGESGKSTIFKQMQIIHKSGFSARDCLQFKNIIYANILQSMRVLLNAAQQLGIPVRPENRDASTRLMAYTEAQIIQNIMDIMSPSTGAAIAALWADPGIQECFLQRNKFQLNDSAEYYFNEIERICQPNYIPTQQDVLRSRVKTVGITEEEFEIEGHKFRMFDVGGQRTERRKWIHVFDDVTAIIFVTSLSEFDQNLLEDEGTNRMKESLTLFDEICNHRLFRNTPIIIFFNKTDLFERKLKDQDLSKWFPEYKGGSDLRAAKQFIESMFLKLNRVPGKQVYSEFSCATDTDNIKFVFNATKDIYLCKALDDANMMD